MTVALAVAASLVAGVDYRRVALLATALLFPAAVLALAALTVFWARRNEVSRSVVFCDVVAAELRSGAPMLSAIQAALASVRLAHTRISVPVSLKEASSIVADEFDDIGDELSMTVAMAARAGGRSADLFDEIGAMALARSEIAHEVRVASSAARATGFVFLVAPVIYLGLRARTGGLGLLLAHPEQRVAAVAGLVLFIAGLVVAGFVLRRSR